jgi:hemoglobin
MSTSLYDELGGFSAVRKLVSAFYDRVLEEESLTPFFEETDMASLVDHQTKFFSTLLGGPASYTRDQLERIHAGMGIGDRHFELVIELLLETLEDNDMNDEHIQALAEEVRGYRSVIVSAAQ